MNTYDFTGVKKAKCECGSEQFNVIKRTYCLLCKHNRVWDEENEQYIPAVENKPDYIGEREVSVEGECEYGSSYGDGCLMAICAICGKFVDSYVYN